VNTRLYKVKKKQMESLQLFLIGSMDLMISLVALCLGNILFLINLKW